MVGYVRAPDRSTRQLPALEITHVALALMRSSFAAGGGGVRIEPFHERGGGEARLCAGHETAGFDVVVGTYEARARRRGVKIMEDEDGRRW